MESHRAFVTNGSLRMFVPNGPLRRSAVLAAALAVAVVGTLTANSNGVPRGAELRTISSRLDGGVSTVLIEATEPVGYITSQPDPLTVLVDLRNVRAGRLPSESVVGPLPPVTSVRVEDGIAPDGAPMARVRVTMDRAAAHRVRSSRNLIYVEINRDVTVPLAGSREVRLDGSATLQRASSTAQSAGPRMALPVASTTAPRTTALTLRAEGATKLAPATSLRAIRTVQAENGVGIVLVGDGTLVASTVEEARDLPPRVLLDFRDVTARGVPAITQVNQGDVQRVRVAVNSRSPLITRVVIDLAKKLAYRIEQAGDELRVWLGGAAAVPAAAPPAEVTPPVETPAPAPPPAPTAAPEPVAAPAPVPVRQETPVLTNTDTTTPTPPTIAAAIAQAPEAQQPVPPPPAQQPAPPAPVQPRFTGHLVSLDFQGADLRSVLRTFSEISGLNIVIDPNIQGTVDVSLRDVPWDQALDIILRANKLGYSVDGTIVRIAPLTVLAQENEERRKLAEAQALAGELRVLTIPLSYARAPELVPILTRSALSSRGEVQVDARTNTLIVRDLPDRLTTASDLIKTLDRPQPQVEIEARIVQTTRDFARQLGVQWGFNGRVDPALGNTTGLAFPNSGSVSGRTGGVQGPLQGNTNADTGVNLGISGAPMSAIGIALGSINGSFNLDVVLNQLERTGRGRLLSTPRVSTQNNVEAEMTQGIQIPIQTIANNTVTVSFKDAALTLRVTPQITAANTVIMRINLENASPDFSRSVGGIPPIDTQRAITTVLVADGETTVIGGIYISREQMTEGRVPVLHRIPLLGWLFKRDEMSDESRELLIFITPRITRG